MGVRVPTGEIRRTCHQGTSGWKSAWDIEVSVIGDQLALALTTMNDDERPVLTVTLKLDREEAEGVLDQFLAAMVRAGQRE